MYLLPVECDVYCVAMTMRLWGKINSKSPTMIWGLKEVWDAMSSPCTADNYFQVARPSLRGIN